MITCPICSHQNPDHSTFCIRCGNRIQATNQMNPITSGTSQPTALSQSAQPTFVSATPQPPPASMPNTSSGYTQPATFPPPVPPPPVSPQWGTVTTDPYSAPVQQAGVGLVSLRRAFAGKGTLITHHSWLLNEKQIQAASIRSTVQDILNKRGIPGLTIQAERLTERGIMMEERDYLTTHRGVTTVFVYVTPAGQDLYISRATTVLPAISNVRVAILILFAIAMIIGFVSHPNPTSLYTGDAFGFLLASFFALLSIPVLLGFILFFIRSFVFWLVEKDFWRLLRPNTLTDFNMDDIALLEHATDDTIRLAIEQLGLDATKITPPASGYVPKQRIRLI